MKNKTKEKQIVRSKDKDWEPFIILAIGMGLL